MNTAPPGLAPAEPGTFGVEATVAILAVVALTTAWLVAAYRPNASEDPMPERQWTARIDTILIGAFAVLLLGFGGWVVLTQFGSTSNQGIVDELCLAAEQAEDEPAQALATFNGSPHNALHGLETDLRREEPAAGSRLTRAKQAAESALIARSPAAAELTEALAAETAEAYKLLGHDVSGCT